VNKTVAEPVYNLLLQSIRVDNPEDAKQTSEKIISGNDINLDDLFFVSEQHSIKPQLANLINRSDSSLIPKEFREKINLEHRGNLCHQMNFVAEFLRIRKLLNDAGILIVPFKGFWLANEFYGNLADRESVDIDLFVKENDLEQIAVLMAGNGYMPQKDFLPYTVSEIKKNFHEYNFDRFEGDERLFHVEFHWRMSTEVYGMDIRLEDLSSEILKGKLQDREIDVFSPSANFLLTVMHHGGRDLFRELKQVLDFAMILKKDPGLDWMMILNEAERFKIRNLVFVAVRLAADLSGVQVPDEISEKCSSLKVKKLAENRKSYLAEMPAMRSGIIPGLNRWLFRVRALSGLKVKIRMTWVIVSLLLISYLVPAGLRKYFPYSELSS
jgi:hypothetical protein